MGNKNKFNGKFTVQEWEEVAYEVDLTKIGKHPDWHMLAKYAPRLGMNPRTLRRWLLIWVACGKKTEDMLIIGGRIDDEQSDSKETTGIQELPDLTWPG